MTNQKTKTIVVTGGTGGIGRQTAVGLARTGAHVVITGRDAERGEQARALIATESGNPNIDLAVGDVSSRAGVDALVANLTSRFEKIDVLINNAGYLGGEPARNADGFEMHFAVNVVAPRRLTLALLPSLKAAHSARVLNVTGGDKPAEVDVDNLQAEKGFKGLMTYTHSKSVKEAMSMGLATELEPVGVFVNVVFPGRASTSMTQSLSTAHLPGPMKLMMPIFKFMLQRDDGGKSAAKAATSSIWAATTTELDGVSGAYIDSKTKQRQLDPTAYDPAIQARIVEVIEHTPTI